MIMKTYAVVGLGRFGDAVARELMRPVKGHRPTNEVLAIDIDGEHIQTIADHVTRAVQADLRDPEVVQALNVASCDVALVCIGSDISTSVLVTLNLKEAGAKCVIAKASSEAHRRILERIGADRVIFPEHDVGRRLAHTLSQHSAYDLLDLSDDYAVVRVPIPKSWWGKTLAELNVRAKYDINVLTVQASGSSQLQVSPSPQTPLPEQGGVMSVLTSQEALARLQQL